ncbi:phenylalanine--tRNA ligase subunit beta [Rhabdothermincola sp.]|uniref:phenylalanine--tRNA ligase subunit beta n=1 Tax=Rhabdothermincola sp. TaxID=2820405 RepID=UPI002FDF42E6
MKVLLSWLREFAPFEGDPVMLGEQMSDLGMTVESIQRLGEGLDGIVVATVLALRRHPDADKIQLVEVDAGDGQPCQICCGAFNMSVGDKVPLATLGTVMPSGLRIERRKLRGEWSNGMLCSAAELGLGTDHSGILILDPALEAGTDLRTALGIETDVLYDLEINPNRPDAMSVAGVARDLAARLQVPFSLPDPAVDEKGAPLEFFSVEILDTDLCGRFVARLLRGVTVGSSPAWLRTRLLALGMRPINHVVDVSNYVMLELGQPNHTFDLSKIRGGGLRVRWARDGERIVTLDGVERSLRPTDGVVADGEGTPVAIAGVMGGLSTEIDQSTTDVLLEMAWWQPMAIARTSKRLGLRSEASARFERGTDPEVIDLAARRFAELLVTGSGELAPGVIDERGDLPVPPTVRVRTSRVNSLLGTSLSTAQIVGYLEPIGFRCEPAANGGEEEALAVTVPSFRPDTATETDVIEEVARHFGYGHIPRTQPTAVRTGGLTERQRERRLVREVMVGLGVDEAMPMPFLDPSDLERTGSPLPGITITNPLAAEESVLRTSLRPGLLKALGYNASHRNLGVRLFEVGKVFRVVDGQELPDEPEHLGVALAGADAFEAVGVWRVLAGALAVADARLEQVPVAGLHPTRSAQVVVAGEPVGAVGEIDPEVLAGFGIAERVAWLELDLDHLLALPHGERHYRPVSRYPSSDLDLAFEVDEGVPAAEVESVIRSTAGELLSSLRLFDVFRGPPVPEGRRSLAYRLRLQAEDRTLTDDEVAELRSAVVAAVEAALPARLRG